MTAALFFGHCLAVAAIALAISGCAAKAFELLAIESLSPQAERTRIVLISLYSALAVTLVILALALEL